MRERPSNQHVKPGPRRRAFTLVEVLVVISIIAVLVALLLPMVNRAWLQAKQVRCLSQLSQLAAAFHAYALANGDGLPASASYALQQPEDWIYWEPGRGFEAGAIAKVLQGGNAVFTCPADDVSTRARTSGYGPYRYSYVMNSALCAPTGHSIRLTRVSQPAAKVLLYEEDASTIDDGYGTAQPDIGINLLAVRHDAHRSLDNPGDPLASLQLNLKQRGNVAFCDGHAEFVTREEMHNLAALLP